MMYPNEIKNIVVEFYSSYKNGNFEKAESLAHQLLNATIEAKVQASVLEVMLIDCNKHSKEKK